MRVCVAGPVYRPGEGFEEGWLLLEEGRVVEEGTGRPPQPVTVEGVVLPAPVDAHTHVGDRAGRDRLPAGLTLAEAVAPPGGYKHRLLRETPREVLVSGMRQALGELVASGARGFVDFREQGEDGVGMLREACRDVPLDVRVFGRCAGAWDEDEARRILQASDGYGLSGLGDVASEVPERAARLAQRMGKRVALHVSESRREDIGRALDLAPGFLVHGLRCEGDDLAAISAAGVPLVLCPRSNARFGLAPDLPALLAAGVPLALGSDNAMLHPLDVLGDARLLARRHPKVPHARLLDMAIAGGARVLGGKAPRQWLRRGEPGRLLVLAKGGPDPYDAIFGTAARRIAGF